MRTMSAVVVGLVLLVTLVVAGTAQASNQGRWIPGTPYMISEEDANDFLDDVADFAYCQGISRFGKQGEFPYEEYTTFDCSLDFDDMYCSNVRYRAVKGSRRGYYRMKGNLTTKNCY